MTFCLVCAHIWIFQLVALAIISKFKISALARAQGLITHTTSRRFCQPVYETNYVLPCETDRTTTRCFFGEDNSAISLPIELKLSGMVDLTIADVRYYVPCCLRT